jgi:hypothetical protein
MGVVRLDEQPHPTRAQIVRHGTDPWAGICFTTGKDPHRWSAETVREVDQRAELGDHRFVLAGLADLRVAGQDATSRSASSIKDRTCEIFPPVSPM